MKNKKLVFAIIAIAIIAVLMIVIVNYGDYYAGTNSYKYETSVDATGGATS